jgi:hypothetical protein
METSITSGFVPATPAKFPPSAGSVLRKIRSPMQQAGKIYPTGAEALIPETWMAQLKPRPDTKPLQHKAASTQNNFGAKRCLYERNVGDRSGVDTADRALAGRF